MLCHFDYEGAIWALQKVKKMIKRRAVIIVKEPMWYTEATSSFRGGVFKHLRPRDMWINIFTRAGLQNEWNVRGVAIPPYVEEECFLLRIPRDTGVLDPGPAAEAKRGGDGSGSSPHVASYPNQGPVMPAEQNHST